MNSRIKSIKNVPKSCRQYKDHFPFTLKIELFTKNQAVLILFYKNKYFLDRLLFP